MGTTKSPGPRGAAAPVRFADLRDRAVDAGWSDELWELLERARPDRGAVEMWLDHGFPPPEGLLDWARTELQFIEGSLQRRLAVWSDNDVVAEVYANSPETVGDWAVTVEHEPYAFSQLRLQENGTTMLIEDQRLGQAVISRAIRNAMVGGKERTVMAISGMRVHQDHQGKGLSNAMIFCPGLATMPFASIGYWYGRRDNSSAPWLAAIVESMEDQPEGASQETTSLSATVFHLDLDPSMTPGDAAVRPMRREELPRICELVNRTNAGLDLAGVHSPDSLWRRLNHWGVGPLPEAFDPVYDAGDYLVYERDGEIVACGGLWDRGANMRERWVHSSSGEEHLVSCGALLDYGYADGAAQDMASLVDEMAARGAAADRSSLLLAIEHDHDLLARFQGRLRSETRDLMVMPFAMPGLPPVELDLHRPATDLAYW